jgi:predicted transglutaminase-like cysteine proteinase
MKRIITCLAVVLTLFSVSSLFAQAQDPSSKAAAMKQKMKDDLKLTDLQADSVSAIHQEFRPKMKDIYMDQSLGEDDKKAKLGAINDQANKRIQAVLGDDLYKQYLDWWSKNRPQRGGGGNK